MTPLPIDPTGIAPPVELAEAAPEAAELAPEAAEEMAAEARREVEAPPEVALPAAPPAPPATDALVIPGAATEGPEAATLVVIALRVSSLSETDSRTSDKQKAVRW